MDAQRILLVDDEESILTFLRLGLATAGFDVRSVSDGRAALQSFYDYSPHLVVLDRMLPDLDGTEVCARIREISRVPILMLTARDAPDDRVFGLDAGADDYVGKPVRLAELLARINALLRRAPRPTMQIGPLSLDTVGRTATLEDHVVELTPREAELLATLMQAHGQVVTRESILHALWGFEFEGVTNVVEVHVRALRSKLGDDARRLIRSVRGVGYSLRVFE